MAQAGKSKKRRGGTVVLDEPPVGTGSESPKAHAYIVLLQAPGGEIGRRTTLEGEHYVLGREDDADILLDRDTASRQHAELTRNIRGQWLLRDLESTNGTFVNERRISEVMLEDGDQLRFGDVIYKYLSGTNVESKYHEEIYQMSTLDALTGAYNRRYLMDFLERELASAARHQNPLTLVMFDIDHFKQVNDVRGHLCGDAVLRQLSDRVKTRIRREDLFARYGGEEFAAVLNITQLDGGLRFAESVRLMVSRHPFTFEGEEIPLTISLGVAAVLEEPGVTPDVLIQRADERLFEAKRAGRNRVCPDVPPRRATSEG